MSKTLSHLVTATMAAALFVGGSTSFAEAPASPKDLNDYLCKDVMRLSGSERENALALVHGYRLGKKNTTQFEVATLAALTDKFIEHCLENPNDKALPAFEKLGE
jgi:hypothetical protein